MALLNLSNASTPQLAPFSKARDNTRLMMFMDRITAVWGHGTLSSATEGTHRKWKVKRGKTSPEYATQWAQLPVVS